jgi:murein DD-endopeptidase MepM/ murein hydrolase activator NlpD
MGRRRWLQFGIVGELLLLLSLICVWGMRLGEDVQQVESVQEDASGMEVASQATGDYIKWVDFDVSYQALCDTYQYDVDTYEAEIHLNWVELLAYLATKYGGDFSSYKSKDLTALVEKLQSGETTMEELTKDMQYYSYYREAYGAVLDGMVGEYQIQEAESETSENLVWKTYYGLKAYSPIAKTFPYSDYDDFGVSRSYGYRRQHLGHDFMGQVGTPIIAVESGVVTALGWNQYGGWRIGIQSFDGKRYYYYAHLRQNVPFAEGLAEGDIVQAGDVIGYMGRTGYSTTENVNNIDTYHLHFGMQLIFDESQREGNNEIWIDVYALSRFLSHHRSEVVRNDETKQWHRKYEFKDPAVTSE